MPNIKGLAIKGALAGAGTVASTAGVWQAYEGGSANPYPFLTPTDLLKIEDNGGTRTEKLAVGGCFKHYFPGAEISWAKQESTEETAATETGPFGYGYGDVQGCLMVDMKYRDTNNKKAISLESELTLIKGDHGLAVWTTLNNLTGTGSATQTVYVVRLSRRGWSWQVDKGYSWNAYGMGYNAGYDKLEVYFDNNEFAKLDGTNDQNCTSSCDLFTKSKPTKTLKYSGYFRTDLGEYKSIFTKLKIKNDSYEPDFWGQEDVFIEENTKTRDRGFWYFKYVYDGHTWKKGKGDKDETNLPTTLKAWFKPFTEARGKWIDMHYQFR